MTRNRIITEALTVALLLAIYVAMVMGSTFRKSAVFDEPFHITGGYNYLKNGDLKMCSEGGFFTEAMLALPLMTMDLKFPYKGKNFFSEVDEWENTRDFMFRSGNDTESILSRARLMVIAMTLLFGLSIYFISRSIFGHYGGLISLFLFVFSPEILAHGGLATTDMISTFVLLAAVWAIWKLVNEINPSTVILSSIILGLLFVTKHSAPVIIPFYLIMIMVSLFSRKPFLVNGFGRLRELCTQKEKLIAMLSAGIVNSIIIVIFIWGACGFRYSMVQDESGSDRMAIDQSTNAFLKEDGSFGKVISVVKEYKILPEAYLYGYAFFLKFGQKRYAFLDGELAPEGWWHYFIFSFFYKTPFPFLLLLLLCAFSLYARNRGLNNPLLNFESGKFRDLIPFAVFIVLYMIFAISNRSNIGNRHLLPIYPVLFIICGWIYYIILEGRKFVKWTAGILLGLTALACIYAWPNYISYMNLIAGGPQNGYRHLVDSSLDWGQDLKGLKSWLDKNNTGKSDIYFSCFSNSDVGYYGLKVKMLPSYRLQKSDEIFELNGGIYCISATMFQFVYLAETCYNETGFKLENADDKYFEALSAEIKSFPETSRKSELAEEQLKKYKTYEYLRFLKLCLYLHNREPDANIGNSILVFKLKDEDVEKALGK
ncbi:MAG TPA: hypothetical protein DCZ94_14815 [Lentisphaeria bacterium]|nr:MAG: hypothetical protein A2X48_02970 [Lentisphaerae bacterium GWF2_49_21]HBC88220.1 hypothetical protein [Lentisphaeria bacterium]